MFYWLGFCIAHILSFLFFPIKYIGMENLPKDSSYILACNHISNLDPFVVGICQPRRFSFLAKEEMFKKPFLSWVWYQYGAFPIKRDERDFKAIREVFRRLKKGPLVLFPEGTRGVSGRQKKPQQGIGLIAKKSNLPVIPTFIQGSDKALPPGSKWFKRHKVQVTFGEPIAIRKSDPNPQIATNIMSAIAKLS